MIAGSPLGVTTRTRRFPEKMPRSASCGPVGPNSMTRDHTSLDRADQLLALVADEHTFGPLVYLLGAHPAGNRPCDTSDAAVSCFAGSEMAAIMSFATTVSPFSASMECRPAWALRVRWCPGGCPAARRSSWWCLVRRRRAGQHSPTRSRTIRLRRRYSVRLSSGPEYR